VAAQDLLKENQAFLKHMQTSKIDCHNRSAWSTPAGKNGNNTSGKNNQGDRPSYTWRGQVSLALDSRIRILPTVV
jgi:hypothetical protein